jgi:hypothetical protein
MGTGVAVWIRPIGQPNFGKVGSVTDDVGVSGQWHRIAAAAFERRTLFHVSQPGRAWWKAATRHANVIGRIVMTPEGDAARVENVPAERAKSLCGRRVDWVELPRPS